MPVDREAALKKAEKLLRQGKLEGAIQEYVRVVEDNPRDWNAMNALGDLYARAGNAEQAVANFTRIADYLHDEGFFPKAAALYKKALKTQSDHEPSLRRLAEIATRQGLVADAKLYWNHVARLRRGRGDETGANQCVVALGALPDGELKLAAGRAAQALGDEAGARGLLEEAADIFEKSGRGSQALDALVAAAQQAGADGQFRTGVIRRCLAAGDIDRARPLLSSEAAGSDPDLLLALGRLELEDGKPDEARRAFSRLLAIAPQRSADILAAADELAREGHRDAAFGCVDAVAETATLGGDLDGALDALQAFLRHGAHVPALLKLVEVAVDAGRDELLMHAQERLADAYLDEGRGAEARPVAEDLVSRNPHRSENVERLRRALAQSGVEDVEGTVARYLEPAPSLEEPVSGLEPTDIPADLDFAVDRDLDVQTVSDLQAGTSDPVFDDEILLFDPDARVEAAPPLASVALPSPQGAPVEDRVSEEPEQPAGESQPADPVKLVTPPVEAQPVEIDLSEALARLAAEGSAFAPPAAAPGPAQGKNTEAASGAAEQKPEELESVFARMRVRVREHAGPVPAAQLEHGLQLLEEGRAEEAVADLEAAARTPMLRFRAAMALGRFHAGRGELEPAVEWLERAADAPAASEDESLGALYDLADVLERMGEQARALAVLLEIDADQGAYRDVPARIEQLTREAGGRRR